MLIEACIDSVDDALAAETAGAQRLELCANLAEGGISPSAGLVKTVVSKSSIPVFVMVRPRGGDFLYSGSEIEVMLRDAAAIRGYGAHGVVSGALNANATIDEEATAALIEAAHPLAFTFHRAFDFTRDLRESLDVLLALGCSRVLTSGGAATAYEGRETLTQLCRQGAGRVTIMAGGAVRANHIAELAASTGIREFHIGARKLIPSAMRVRSQLSVSRTPLGDDLAHEGLDNDQIAKSMAALAHLNSPPFR